MIIQRCVRNRRYRKAKCWVKRAADAALDRAWGAKATRKQTANRLLWANLISDCLVTIHLAYERKYASVYLYWRDLCVKIRNCITGFGSWTSWKLNTIWEKAEFFDAVVGLIMVLETGWRHLRAMAYWGWNYSSRSKDRSKMELAIHLFRRQIYYQKNLDLPGKSILENCTVTQTVPFCKIEQRTSLTFGVTVCKTVT